MNLKIQTSDSVGAGIDNIIPGFDGQLKYGATVKFSTFIEKLRGTIFEAELRP